MALISDFPDGIGEGADWVLVEKKNSKGYVRVPFAKVGGGGLAAWMPIDGSISYQCVAGDRLIVSSSSGTGSLILPSSPAVGNEIQVIGLAEVKSNPAIFSAINLLEEKQITGLKLFVPYQTISLIFLGALAGWVSNPANIVSPIYAGINLTFSSFGDTNGLAYYLGTNRKTQAWSNPINSNRLNSSASAGSSNSPAILVDRQDNSWYSANSLNSFVRFSLPAGQFTCSGYAIKTRNEANSNHPRNWSLDGSLDDVTWFNLDTRIGDTSLNAINQWKFFDVSVAKQRPVKSLRLTNTGVDSSGASYLCFGEVEFYGVFHPQL